MGFHEERETPNRALEDEDKKEEPKEGLNVDAIGVILTIPPQLYTNFRRKKRLPLLPDWLFFRLFCFLGGMKRWIEWQK